MSRPVPKTSPHSRSSADDPGGGGPVPSRSGAARTTKQKGCGTPERRSSPTSASCDAARALQGAHAFRRSTAALAQGTHASQGLSFGPCFAEPAPSQAGVSRRRRPRLQRGTSRAGPSAGRRDVQSRPGTDCKSVRGHRSRPMARRASGPSPSRERGLRCISNGDASQGRLSQKIGRSVTGIA